MIHKPYHRLTYAERLAQRARNWTAKHWRFCAVMVAQAVWLYTVFVGVGIR